MMTSLGSFPDGEHAGDSLSRAPESIRAARELVRDLFGFADFLPFQEEVIGAIMKGEDILVVLPTGSGKSLCFQIPALLHGGLTIVISPLIALMKDQIDSLRAHNLPVEYLNSSLSAADTARVLDSIRIGSLKMIYIAPERLRDGLFLNALLSSRKHSLLWVVDEAHCITEWGHDFRTDYLYIPDALDLIAPGSQLVMFTATATPIVREDILAQMRRPSARTICGNFDRPNLYLGCRQTPSKTDKLQALGALLRKPGSGIIYTATRRQCEDVNRFLQESGKRSDYYHAGRSSAERAEVQERFLSGELDVITATNAFGMGLDKPDIRFIVHYAHPASVDAYYQEIGRGGRDGQRCDCILLYSRFDRKVQERFIIDSTPSLETVEECFTGIAASTSRSGKVFVNRQFHDARNVELFELQKAGVLKRSTLMCGSASIYLSREYEQALDVCTSQEKKILAALDVHLGLSRKGYVDCVDANDLRQASFPALSEFELEQSLLAMSSRGIIAYRPGERGICYEVLDDSLSDQLGEKIEESVSLRRAFKMSRLEMMANYGTLKSCLREYLIGSLGDTSCVTSCSFCDNCI